MGHPRPAPCGTEAASSSLSLRHKHFWKGHKHFWKRPLYSFTLPGAASCKWRVSRAGGIFTHICPKPGLQKAVIYQKTDDFGRAGICMVLGRLSQGWAEIEGGDPSSRN